MWNHSFVVSRLAGRLRPSLHSNADLSSRFYEVTGGMDVLDEAAVLSILRFCPDTRERARLALVNRLWYQCVVSGWQQLEVPLMSPQKWLVFSEWLGKQLPTNPATLRRLAVYYDRQGVRLDRADLFLKVLQLKR